jgi:hypothetical protein
MGQRFLLAIGAVLVIGAVALGTVGAARGGWSVRSPGFGMMSGFGPGRGGMMGGYGRGGMMGGYGPGGMMGGYYAPVPAGTQTISIDQAQQSVEQYVTAHGGSNLVLDELIEFQDNFYAIVKEKSTRTGAFELLVNRVTGAVGPEPGPNMMWNTKYGMMAGGMMGFARPSGAMTVSKDRAGQIAQTWLDANLKGAKIEEPDTFHGYYTVHFTQSGKVAGMLSVNGYSSQVWYHTWHGAFIQEKQADS